ncbi:MAG: hypothetical protein U1E17_06930 [Geminicoccaceae bacterium]
MAEYTDFCAGRHHVFNVGTMYRGPENALPANWLDPDRLQRTGLPVVVSGTEVALGQVKV